MVENLNPQGKQPVFRPLETSSLSELEEKKASMKYYISQGQTDEFSKFMTKIGHPDESLQTLATNNPDWFAHFVLGHGFMEYANVKGLLSRSGYGKKEDYLEWARANDLPEELLEKGWEEFIND